MQHWPRPLVPAKTEFYFQMTLNELNERICITSMNLFFPIVIYIYELVFSDRIYILVFDENDKVHWYCVINYNGFNSCLECASTHLSVLVSLTPWEIGLPKRDHVTARQLYLSKH